MLFDSLDDEGDPARHLERMKCEFLLAQQRRRARASREDASPDSTDDVPRVTPPAPTEGATGVAEADSPEPPTCAVGDSASRQASLP